MAWKATGVWKKPQNINEQHQKKDDSSFPGLKPSGVEATASKVEFDEVQREEVFALESIYAPDFKALDEGRSAWKKSEPSFEIRIKASTDEDFAVTLHVVLTASYPKSPPLLTLKDHVYLRAGALFKVQKFIESRPKDLAAEGEPMMHTLVEGIRDILEDAAIAKVNGKEVSLEEERALHEATLAKQAHEQEEAERQRMMKEKEEEEQAIHTLVEEEMKRKRETAKESRKKNRANEFTPPQAAVENEADAGRVVFDQVCRMMDKTGNTVEFTTVTGKTEHSSGPFSKVYHVRPVLTLASGSYPSALALKEVVLRAGGKDAESSKRQVKALEQHLEALKKLHHRNLLDVLGFTVDRGSPDGVSGQAPGWTVTVLSPMAEKGPLDELLEFAGNLDVKRVRTWTRDLLDGLGFLHNKGLVHQDIHLGNILLFRENTGEIVPKLADAVYERDLHNIRSKQSVAPSLNSARSSYWLPPEITGEARPQYTQKTDIWDMGIVFLQMIFGLEVPQHHHSPTHMMESLSLSGPMQELVGRFFKNEPKKRPRAFELSSSEFLATDAPIFLDESPNATMSGSASISSLPQSLQVPVRLRRESMTTRATSSRYAEDFVEEGRLGKGGFGEVVKARQKLDGQIYAIKKIIQRGQASLTEVLKEVRLLSQLSHPAVVRYYNTWVEEIPDHSDTEGETSTEGLNTEDSKATSDLNIEFTTSRGLDFISSSGYPQIEFGYDSEDDEDDDDDDNDDDDDDEDDDDDMNDVVVPGHAVGSPDARGRKIRFQRPFRTLLYISMEYCEKRTLRDLITRGLYKNMAEVWRLFRQILEGLAYIHQLSIVHRDLKPENIFISPSPDGVDNVKIGDFGLATVGQFALDRGPANALDTDDVTRSIGTAYYAAPEIRSGVQGSYSTKVDMYSLGIIFFEMSYPPMMGMQRALVLDAMRRTKPSLPPDFKPPQKVVEEIILSLITHNPRDRPSSIDLLKSGKLPVQGEKEQIRRVLAGIKDPTSPYYEELLSTMFAHPVEPAKDYTWDLYSNNPTSQELLHQEVVQKTLTAIFRRHGALNAPRTSLYPLSAKYAGTNVVKLLDTHGIVHQLPFDLVMGHARMLAKHSNGPIVQRTFTFAPIYRGRKDTGQPHSIGEVDFDIVTTDTLDLALKEAEVIKVLDEIVAAFPALSSSQMCFHIGHSDLLQLIFEYCRVEVPARRAVADVLSKLNIHSWTWQKIRAELRSPAVGISATSVDELARFDFRDTPNKAFNKLKSLFDGTDMVRRAAPTLAHLKEVYEFAKRMGVGTRIYICPLNSLKEDFYSGGILFSCLYDKKTRDVFAAGGRYDSLIRENRPKMGGQVQERHAVGFSLAWERLARIPKHGSNKAFLKRAERDANAIFNVRRCDVLVASFDPALLRSSGLDMLSVLWSHDISAELARDARSPEELLSSNRDENYSWLVIIKPDQMLKIKTLGRKDVADADIPYQNLISWFRSEIRDRDAKTILQLRGHTHNAEAGGASGAGEKDREQEVHVLVSMSRSKKFNRQAVVDQAQAQAAALVQSFLEGPILAVETTDQVLHQVQATVMTDPESWKRVEQAVTTAERRYVREMHDQLSDWRDAWESNKGSRHAFIYNFRTATCVYYDLGL